MEHAVGHKFTALPVLYFSEFNQSVMRNPHVERYITHDVYISPIELKTEGDAGASTTLAKGQNGEAGGVALHFLDFERVGTMGDPNGFTIKAKVAIGDGKDAQVVTPSIVVGPYGLTRVPADLPGGGTITMANVDPAQGTVELAVVSKGAVPAPETLAVELSTKPLIGLVWLGMGMLLFGALLGIRRRLALQHRSEAAPAAVPARAAAAP